MVSWNDCPTELLCSIFKHLRTDTKALTTCMVVNRKWQDVAKYVAEHYSLWPIILKNEVINDAETFINKTTHMHLRDLYKNVVLWNHVQISHFKCIYNYQWPGIRNIQVFKEKLFFISNKSVVAMKLTDFETTTPTRTKCLNYEENDRLAAELILEEDLTHSLCVYKKTNPGSIQIIPRVKLYKLAETFCYIYTIDNDLWCHKPALNMQSNTLLWYRQFRGRLYSNTHDVVTSLHVCNQKVYVMTKYGTVWGAETEPARFEKVYTYKIPKNLTHHDWVMFDDFNCVASVKKTDDINRVIVQHDAKAQTILLRCQDLSCAKQHGPVLFLGYKDGLVEIRNASNHVPNSNHKNAGKVLKVQLRPGDDPEIIAIEVMEIDNGHYLLVSTREQVFHFHITYPESLLQQL